VRVISFAAWFIVQCLCKTCRIRTVGYEDFLEIVNSGKGCIVALWHGRTLIPVYYCRKLGVWAITSLSRDGEIQTGIVRRFGFKAIRGSSGRGGMKAALIASKKLQEGAVLAVTPDGPTGPANEVQDGIIFLANLAKCPIIPVGVAASPRRVVTGTWDSYMLPKLFSRAIIVFGNPIDVAEMESNGQGLEAKEYIKSAIDECQRRAEELVQKGSS